MILSLLNDKSNPGTPAVYSVLSVHYGFSSPKNEKTTPSESSENEVRIYDIISSDKFWGNDDVCDPTLVLDQLSKMKGPTNIRISSKGGDVEAGMRIYNRLLDYGEKNELTTIVDGYAYSTAGWIGMAAPANRRFINTGGLFLAHNPRVMGVFSAENEFDQAKTAWTENRNSIIDIFHERTSIAKESISNLMDKDTPIGAKQAVEQGFFSSVRSHVANLSIMNSFDDVPDALRDHIASHTPAAPRTRNADAKLLDRFAVSRFEGG